MANYREDIVNIDLECGNIFRSWMKHTIGEGDALADRFGVRVFRNGVPFQLSGTCTGYFIRADGETIPVVNGVIDGNLAYVTLIDTCYAMEGVFSLAIKVDNGSGENVTMRIVDGVVSRTTTDIIVDPGTIIPSIEDLINQINTAVVSIPPNYAGLAWSLMRTGRDVLSLGGAPESGTYNGGITVTKINNSSYHFEGTISGSSFVSWYESLTVYPEWLLKGKKYILEIEGATANNNNGIYFDIIGWVNGNAQSLLNAKYLSGKYEFTIPTSFNGGIYIRAGWLNANSGHVVNETITYHIYSKDDETILQNGQVVHQYGGNTKDFASCNDVPSGVILFIASEGGVLDITDFPFSGPGTLVTFGYSNFKIQYAFSWNRSPIEVKSRSFGLSGWSEWVDGASGSTVTIEQEVSRDTYNNEYNINVSPQITTDSNGWLQPVDTNTENESDKTDMTSAIMAMLTQTGYCHLAPGIYYVSGNIDMPADSMIEGCGKQTIIRLLQSTTSGYIVRMHTRSTLKNVCLSGGYNPGSIADGNIGGRKGISYIGNRDGQSSGVTPSTCTLCMIEGCFFENLDSGIYGYNAGGGLQEGLEVSNCYFTRCKAGINLDYWTEYCKFTNCVMFQCYYACINNGGNNVFLGCTFHGVIGFLVDNSSGNKQNIAHGSVIGCTFNHIDNMNNPSELGQGFGIKVISAAIGFIFANCQLWYGRIHIENSSGIQITGCEFGGLGGSSYPVIETSGSGTVFVDNCLFQSTPVLSFSGNYKLSNCWTYNGVAVT